MIEATDVGRELFLQRGISDDPQLVPGLVQSALLDLQQPHQVLQIEIEVAHRRRKQQRLPVGFRRAVQLPDFAQEVAHVQESVRFGL